MGVSSSWGSTSSGTCANRQPSAVRVKVQTTSNRSSGQSDGGFGDTDGKAFAMSGIPPCCQEISVGPGWVIASSTSFFSWPAP